MKMPYILVIILATVFAVYKILQSFGVFEIASRPNKVVSEIEYKRKQNHKRRFEIKKLQLYTTSVELFRGIFMSDRVYEQHQYWIQRLELRSKVLNRLYTPEEYRGRYVFPVLCSFPLVVVGFIFPYVMVIPGYFLFKLLTYSSSLNSQIRYEDTVIDDNFLDLYLLLYSKLKQGSRARLQGTVENYIDTLSTSKSSKETEVMLRLARYLLNLLSLYEDHVAVPKLHDIYHSATIVNFCNVATQSLNGVENWDNLLTFKLQLVTRRTNAMRERQQKILRSGERSIYAIWVILFILIVIGFYSKLPTGVF